MSKFQFQLKKTGFTLIELLVVISIVGVLSALLITNLVGARSRAADAKKKSELNALATSLRLYYNDHQHYPPSGGNVGKLNNWVGGAEFVIDSTTYMKAMPADYYYFPSSTLEEFILYTKLSNASDEQLSKNYEKCCRSTNSKAGCPSILDTNQYILCEN